MKALDDVSAMPPEYRAGASNQGLPAIRMKGADVSQAYSDVIGRFLGESIPMRFTEATKKGFFKRMFSSAS